MLCNVDMGILDSIFGSSKKERSASVAPALSADEQALDRYRYMLKTAPPETLEQAHVEAFSRLTPEQRRLALKTLADASPPHERAATEAVSPDDPQAMGRLATRAEVRQPGFIERNFGGGGGMGGGGFGGSLLGSFAMGFVGSMVAQSFFSSMSGGEGMMGSADAAEPAPDPGVEANGGDGGDGGDLDAGGDFDGGDFGGDF